MSTAPIALIVSDVDGTLVTSDKRLSAATVAAVARLRAAGIGFTVASARPPVGLTSIVETLQITLPVGAFNGATIVGPDLAVIEERFIPEATAREAAARLAGEGVDVWVFARGGWYLRDPQAPYTDLERRTLQAEPRILPDLGELLAEASKIVGVSSDHAHLAACEARLGGALGEGATVHRSQPYYLDVTPPGLDKGWFVGWLGRRLGLAPERIATLGDAGNDCPMFARSGLSIAMGNADAAVQAAARAVTADNDSEGFAEGVARFILP